MTVPAIASGAPPYTITEGPTLPATWRLDGEPTCTPTSGTPGATATVGIIGGQVNITRIDASVTLTCVYTNTNLPVPDDGLDGGQGLRAGDRNAASPTLIQPGSQITYYLYASNRVGGNQPVTNLVLTDNLHGCSPSRAPTVTSGSASRSRTARRTTRTATRSEPPVADRSRQLSVGRPSTQAAP